MYFITIGYWPHLSLKKHTQSSKGQTFFLKKPENEYKTAYYLIAWLDFFIIGSNDETCLAIQEKSKNSGL